jgi:hypothetical protein
VIARQIVTQSATKLRKTRSSKLDWFYETLGSRQRLKKVLAETPVNSPAIALLGDSFFHKP